MKIFVKASMKSRSGVFFRLDTRLQGFLTDLEYLKHLFDEGELTEEDAYEILNLIQGAHTQIQEYV